MLNPVNKSAKAAISSEAMCDICYFCDTKDYCKRCDATDYCIVSDT